MTASELSAPPGEGSSDRENPFFTASSLPYRAPPFDQIRDEDYRPGIEEGMRRHLAEVDAVANEPSDATFENTIVALERSGQLLTNVLRVFTMVVGANTNDLLQDVQIEMSPRIAAHSDAIYLNDRLFQRVKAIYDRRDTLSLNPEQRMLIERYHLEFVRAGAKLDEADKTRLRAINQEESTLATEFQNRLLAAAKVAALAVDDASELEGLSEAEIASAAELARERKMPGKWVLPLHNTTQQPLQTLLRRRETRQRLFEASIHRSDRGDAVDTRTIILRLAELRAEHARLLGYETWAAFVLADQMAKTPDAAIKLLTDIGTAATAKARGEAQRIQALVDRQQGGVSLEPWDWQHYAEQLRKAEYDIDETQIKPYLELDRVVRDGVFFAATQLFGITFRERTDIPVYHPDVRVFEVCEADGSELALLYTDFFKRDNKNGGAWMDAFVDQAGLTGTKPVIVNVANFTKPAAGQPALLSFDDVTTLFHEFGHALHGMLSDVEYPLLTGTNVPRDFVEFPSQFNEHCALDPAVMARYARHHETGEPMPQELVDKIKKTQTFNQGFALTEYISAAVLDMAWHTLAAGQTVTNVDEFEAEALTRYHMNVHQVPPRYRTTYFAHVWSGGYSAGYYAYLWAEVLDHDAFAMFRETGGMTRANGQRLREMILSRGGTEDPAALFKAFRGRDPNVEPLLIKRGLKPDPAAS